MDIQLTQVTILVADMQTSVQFYRDVLGLAVVSVSEYWSEFEAGAIHLALHPGQTSEGPLPSAGTDAGTLNLVLQVSNLDEACQTLRDKGVSVDGPHLLEGLPPLATFSDPDGVSFTLTAA